MADKTIIDVMRASIKKSTYPCTAIFANETPADWDVHIIAMGADFFYEDNTSAQIGPVSINISGPSGTASLSSPNPTKCVVKVLGAITVKAQNEDPQSFSKENDAVPSHCMIQTNFVLAPKPSIQHSKHKAGPETADVLHLTGDITK